MADIKDRILSLRNEKELTQEKMAKIFNVGFSTVSMWERGERIPRPKILQEICDYFNVDMDYLMGRSDIKNRYQAGLKYDWENKKEENAFNFKERRLKLGLTPKDIADAVGVEESTVRKWELGIISNMKRDKIELLAKALKVSPLDIMGIQKDTPTEIVSNFRLHTKELDKMNLSDKDLDEINSEMQRYFNYIISEFKKNEGDK